jgi:cytochrome c oxidase subunit IV
MAGHEHEHAIRNYFMIFGVLMAGTILTVWAAFQDFGIWNPVIALVIAVVKAVCVVLVFMHVWDSRRLTKLTVAAGFFWLGILFVLTMSDYISRAWE